MKHPHPINLHLQYSHCFHLPVLRYRNSKRLSYFVWETNFHHEQVSIRKMPPGKRRELSGEAGASASMGLDDESGNQASRKRQKKSRKLPGHTDIPRNRNGVSQPDFDIGGDVLFMQRPEISSLVDMSVIHGPGQILQLGSQPLHRFPYRPLATASREIRVVTVNPSSTSATIDCQIEHFYADTASKQHGKGYDALSYTWGSPEIMKTICLQGITVQVRENLWQVGSSSFDEQS